MALANSVGTFLRKAEISAHATADRLLKPRARRARDVPYAPDAITAEWFTAVLCDKVKGGRVIDIRNAAGSVGSSTRQAYVLRLNDAAARAGVPTHVFTKSTPILMQRLLLGLSKCVYGEVGFYRDFRHQVSMEAPKGYFACVAPRSLRSMIVMEDVVASKKAEFNTDGAATTKDEMAGLLTGLAQLHGRYWNDRQLKEHSWLRDTPTYLHDNYTINEMKHWAKVGMEVAPELIPQGITGKIDQIWDGIVNWNRAAATGATTLLHGDAHIAQTYRTSEGQMGFSDWQVLLRGNWAWDVSYIMSTGLDIADRRAWETDLLQHYRDALLAAGGPALSADTAWEAYRANILYAFVAWAFTIGHNSVVQAVQPAVTTSRLVERTAQAIEDLDAIDAALRPKML